MKNDSQSANNFIYLIPHIFFIYRKKYYFIIDAHEAHLKFHFPSETIPPEDIIFQLGNSIHQGRDLFIISLINPELLPLS